MWHINMKYEKRSFIFLGSNMKYENISHFEREQKYDMKYEIWRAWAKIWKNEKYKKNKNQKKYTIWNMKKKAFCDFVNMKYEKFNGQKT